MLSRGVAVNWREYEKEIADFFQSQYPSAQITPNAALKGKFSGVDRQIDLLIEEQVDDYPLRTVVDAKYWKKRIDVGDVEAFLGFLRDVDAGQGVMISMKGYTRGAIRRAHYDDLELDLEVLNFDELKSLQGFVAIPYAGEHGVVLPAPLGWVIDAARRPDMVACLFQRGFGLVGAAKAREFMYLNFWSKDETFPDLQSLLDHQERSIREEFPDAVIEYSDSVERKNAKTKLRSMKIKTYPAPEYTGFVEFKDFIFFCVLFTPAELEKKNLRKLRHVIRRVLPLGVKHARPRQG